MVIKVLSHKEHLYGLSPVWTLMWLFRWVTVLNALVHAEHLNGLSPVWTRICTARPLGCLNRLEHTSHTKFFSSEWLFWWMRSRFLSWNVKPHISHKNSFTFECRFRWAIKLDCFANVRQQKLHFKHLSSFDLRWALRWWVFKLRGPPKYRSHWSHLRCFSAWTSKCVFNDPDHSKCLLQSGHWYWRFLRRCRPLQCAPRALIVEKVTLHCLHLIPQTVSSCHLLTWLIRPFAYL